MTTVTKQQPPDAGEARSDPPGQPAKPIPQDTKELLQSLGDCGSLRAVYAKGLTHLAQRFNSPYAALSMDIDNAAAEEEVKVSDAAKQAWRRHCEGMMLQARYHGTSQARFFRAEGHQQSLAVLVVPLTNSRDGAIGAVSLVIACDRRDVASARLSELQAIMATIDIQAENARGRRKSGAGSSSSSDISSVSKVAAYKSLAEFCFALCNSLKTNLGCDQVSLGLVRGSSVKIACISGFDDLYPRSPGSLMIQQSMCECLDAGEIVCHQAEGKSNDAKRATGHRLHKQWYASLGASPVASVPLFQGDACVAIVSLRNPGGEAFKTKQLDKVQELVTPMTAGLLLLERANRSATRRAWEETLRFGKTFFQPGSWQRKLVAVSLIAAACWLVFAKTDYRLSAPCTVTLTDDIMLSAPYEGSVAEALVRPGETVVAGQPLATMDTRGLTAERDKLQSEIERAQVATLRATQANDIAAAAQAHAERAAALAQLTSVNQKLAAATIRAPSDGVILEGQLQSKVGEAVPLGEPLLRFAPLGRWCVDIHVPEHAAPDLALEQPAAVALSARPDVTIPLQVAQVHGASSIEDGKNVIVAEAELTGSAPKWLRSGMRGVARVDAGRRPVWWVWAHRVVDSIRLQLWSF